MSKIPNRFAVVFRYDNDKQPDLISYYDDDEVDYDRRPLIRLPKSRYLEVSMMPIKIGKQVIRAQVICDDKPSDACFRDGDVGKNDWHPRMYGDFAVIVENEADAKLLMKHPTPTMWWT